MLIKWRNQGIVILQYIPKWSLGNRYFYLSRNRFFENKSAPKDIILLKIFISSYCCSFHIGLSKTTLIYSTLASPLNKILSSLILLCSNPQKYYFIKLFLTESNVYPGWSYKEYFCSQQSWKFKLWKFIF